MKQDAKEVAPVVTEKSIAPKPAKVKKAKPVQADDENDGESQPE
jgi:hypothetical protein